MRTLTEGTRVKHSRYGVATVLFTADATEKYCLIRTEEGKIKNVHARLLRKLPTRNAVSNKRKRAK